MDELDVIQELTPCSFWFFISAVYFSDALPQYNKMLPSDCPIQKTLMQIKQNVSIKKVCQQTLDRILQSQETNQTQHNLSQNLHQDIMQCLKDALTKQVIDEPAQKIIKYFDPQTIRQIQKQLREAIESNQTLDVNPTKIKNAISGKLQERIFQLVGNLKLSEVQEIYQIMLVYIQKQIDDIPSFPARFEVSQCSLSQPPETADLLNMVRTNQSEEEDLLKKLKEKRSLSINPKSTLLNNSDPMKIHANKLEDPYNQSEAQCQVCHDGNYTERNKIVFCAGCNISAHQLCIKLNEIPENDWICELCRFFGQKGPGVMCGICGQRGGLMYRTRMKIKNKSLCEYNQAFSQFTEKCEPGYRQKQIPFKNKGQSIFTYYNYYDITTYSKLLNEVSCQFVWVHYICNKLAIPLRPVFFSQRNRNCLKRNYNIFLKTCQICQRANSGYCIKCKQKSCQLYFHPECACKLKLIWKSAIGFEIYCQDHVPLSLFLEIQNKRKKAEQQIINFCEIVHEKHQFFFKKYLPQIRIQDVLKENMRNNLSQPTFQKALIISHKAGAIKLFIDCQIPQISQPQTPMNISKSTITEIHYKNRQPDLDNKLTDADYWQKICTIVHPEMANRQRQKIQKNLKKHPKTKSLIKEYHLIENFITEGGKRIIKTQFMPDENQNQKQNKNSFCICHSNQTPQMLQCDSCEQWYHFKCIGFKGTEQQAQKMLCYICDKCHPLIKPEKYNDLMNQYTKLFTKTQ